MGNDEIWGKKMENKMKLRNIVTLVGCIFVFDHRFFLDDDTEGLELTKTLRTSTQKKGNCTIVRHLQVEPAENWDVSNRTGEQKCGCRLG